MCKHVLNAQSYPQYSPSSSFQAENGSTAPNATLNKKPTRSPNPPKWYSHNPRYPQNQPLNRYPQIFACKKCKKCFRKDATEFDERCVQAQWPRVLGECACDSEGSQARMSGADNYGSDEYCPHCDNHFVIDAVTPKAALQVEGDDARIDSRMIKDDRVREHKEKSIFSFKDISDRLG
ncbi:hypothetical protein Asppvi_004070 [Aspergillus pseudoviridinutans]|uniref:Uncharacterized protein n=1 Tax=Aspergillus pseudoviridinutans TaxID=1517512 RepID=A0A9P3BC18_9EURO|nr:uncharacterized protein Asppvi_004070 [Aspergillus pseudoviridinutans]GIJ85214.1 hypothetical protein Asppvi_004070 [Aspergillus pseudoviridinutans]